MLIIDSERAKIHDEQIRRQITRQEIADWVAKNEQDCDYYETDELTVTDQIRLIGNALTHQQLEEKLKKLNPALQFIFVRGSLYCPHKKIVLNGKELDGMIYPVGVISERSIHRVEEQEIPDDIFDPNFRVPHPHDYGTSEWVPMEGYEHLWEPADGPHERGVGRWVKTDPNRRPGWTKHKMRWGEKRRGWRTVLVRGVLRKLWTPWQVETEFSVAHTPEWARYMGKIN